MSATEAADFASPAAAPAGANWVVTSICAAPRFSSSAMVCAFLMSAMRLSLKYLT